MNGAEYLCQILEMHGVSDVFGLPGTQNSKLFSELRRARADAFVTTHEMSAGFAALGYAATSDKPAVMTIIGGPGFTYALTPLQEARLDSIPIVCLVFARKHDPSKAFHTQQIDHKGIATAICKVVLEVSSVAELSATIDQAMVVANEGEPGPVVVLIDTHLLDEHVASPDKQISERPDAMFNGARVNDIVKRIQGRSVLLYAGRGCLSCASDFLALAERLGAPVLTSTSARGVIPEDHELAIRSDLVPADVVNQLIEKFDCILALGVKFSENGGRGYRLNMPGEKLVHVDQGPHVVGRNYDTQIGSVANVATVVKSLLEKDIKTKECDKKELHIWRSRFQNSLVKRHEPKIGIIEPPTPERFFELLRAALPADSILVTDSGSHQMLARKYYASHCAHGLLLPTNFQSMGFAISAAMGAKLAEPQRPVLVLTGDGGLQMAGLELLPAVRAKLCIPVIVFNDGYFSLIRNQQLANHGHQNGVALPKFELASYAKSIGARFSDESMDPITALSEALEYDIPTVIEVALDDSEDLQRQQAKSRVAGVAKRVLGHRLTTLVKKLKN